MTIGYMIIYKEYSMTVKTIYMIVKDEDRAFEELKKLMIDINPGEGPELEEIKSTKNLDELKKTLAGEYEPEIIPVVDGELMDLDLDPDDD